MTIHLEKTRSFTHTLPIRGHYFLHTKRLSHRVSKDDKSLENLFYV
jgi:hypothetical protein